MKKLQVAIAGLPADPETAVEELEYATDYMNKKVTEVWKAADGL